MITLFNEEQEKEEEFFGSFLVSLFSLFSLELWQKVCFRASLVFAWHLFLCTFFPFLSLLSSLAIIHHQDNSSLLFVLSRVYTLHTLY